ncbi:hypothetical protein AGMMS50256_32670 [Betaproteobacteria bacterium]|nr:hypothetical protein AGMMS50256_32670 [Betaproteobacteria bacterium]
MSIWIGGKACVYSGKFGVYSSPEVFSDLRRQLARLQPMIMEDITIRMNCYRLLKLSDYPLINFVNREKVPMKNSVAWKLLQTLA